MMTLEALFYHNCTEHVTIALNYIASPGIQASATVGPYNNQSSAIMLLSGPVLTLPGLRLFSSKAPSCKDF